MTRFLLASLLTAAGLSVAVADLGPRPGGPIPGKDKGIVFPPPERAVPVNNVLKFANEFPNHTFWAVTRGANGTNVVPLKPDTSKPLPLPLTMNLTVAAVVYAVPNDVAKTFATPKEFVAAVDDKKLPAGVVSSPVLLKARVVAASDRRASIDRVVVVSGGAKDGVKFAEEDPLPKNPGLPKQEPEPEPEPTSEARPAPRLLAVGVFAALAAAFAGAWVARRNK